jgi:hypothetical protein
VGGNCREKQEATSLGLQVYYKDNDGRAAGPVCKTRRRYSDVMIDKRPGGGQKDTLTAQTDQSKEREDKTEQHTKTQTEKQRTNPDEEEMEELAGFGEVTYRQNSRRQ